MLLPRWHDQHSESGPPSVSVSKLVCLLGSRLEPLLELDLACRLRVARLSPDRLETRLPTLLLSCLTEVGWGMR